MVSLVENHTLNRDKLGWGGRTAPRRACLAEAMIDHYDPISIGSAAESFYTRVLRNETRFTRSPVSRIVHSVIGTLDHLGTSRRLVGGPEAIHELRAVSDRLVCASGFSIRDTCK